MGGRHGGDRLLIPARSGIPQRPAGPPDPGHSTPGHSTPGHSTPGHSTPGHSTPGCGGTRLRRHLSRLAGVPPATVLRTPGQRADT